MRLGEFRNDFPREACALVMLIACVLTACVVSGCASSSRASAPAGIWVGTATTATNGVTQSATAFITPSGEMRLGTGDCVQFVGHFVSYTPSNGLLKVSFTGSLQHATYCNGDQIAAYDGPPTTGGSTASLGGTISGGNSMSLTVVSDAGSYSAQLRLQTPATAQGSAPAQGSSALAGAYVDFSNFETDLAVDGSGHITGRNLSGPVSGTLLPLPQYPYMYSASIQGNGASYAGIAVVTSSLLPNDTIAGLLSAGAEALTLTLRRLPPPALPRFGALLASGRPASLRIAGFGSSVGLGVTLPDPATEAPVEWFGARLLSAFRSRGLLDVQVENLSVSGSAMIQADAYYSAFLAGSNRPPNIAVIVYGMNDGNTPLYNAGQTFKLFVTSLTGFIRRLQNDGADVVVMTTPHPRSNIGWAMPLGTPQIYPTFIAPPVLPEQLDPPVSRSEPDVDILGTGTPIPIAVRHYRINVSMRRAAVATGAALIDVEPGWFSAIAQYGEAALFGPNETVHPDLLGVQSSYQAATNTFMGALEE